MTAEPALRPVHRQSRVATPRTVTALILREMSATYGRSVGGYAWAVLEPVGGILLLATLFSIGLREPPIGSSFTLFYATGLLPFSLFMSVSNAVARSLAYSRQLLAYPRVTFLDALLARFVLNVLTELLVSIVVMAGVLAVIRTGADLQVERLLLGYAMAIAFAAGVGVVNCYLMTAFTIWSSVWGVVTRPLVIVSGVMILTPSVPEPYRSWLMWNPLVHVIGEVRAAFYHGYRSDYIDPPFVFGVSLALVAVGLLFLWRTHRDILDR